MSNLKTIKEWPHLRKVVRDFNDCPLSLAIKSGSEERVVVRVETPHGWVYITILSDGTWKWEDQAPVPDQRSETIGIDL